MEDECQHFHQKLLLMIFILYVFLLTTWSMLLQISHYNMLASACSVKQSEHMLFCKQERDYTLETSLSNVIWSISFHRDPMSIRKKKSWLIYFIHFIHSSHTASHTFLLLLKSAGKKSKIPLHRVSISIYYSSQNLKQLLFSGLWQFGALKMLELYSSLGQ